MCVKHLPNMTLLLFNFVLMSAVITLGSHHLNDV